MKTFLVPVDFSDNSLTALEYAVELANKSYARVLVCHAYEVNSVLPGLTAIMMEECKREAQEKMGMFINKVTSSAATINTIVREGGPEQVIYRLVEEFGVSLVVMGTGGGKNLSKKVFGTTTEAVAKRGLCPVLVIPENAEIKPIEHIVYAADFENGDQVTTMQLLQLKGVFNATLTFLHIKNDRQPNYIDNEYIKESLMKQFPEADLNFVEITNKNVAEGISYYAHAIEASLLAFTILNKQLWEKIWYGSVATQLLQNLKLPMLALPENGRLLDMNPEVKESSGNVNELSSIG